MLILCEKPSVAESFAKALNGKKEKGYYSLPDGSAITYCAGHLYEQAKPSYYFPEDDKKWSFEKLPVIPEKTVYLRKPKSDFQINEINYLLRQHCKDTIIIATDADREGELIARITLQQSGVNLSGARFYRFWSSEALTEQVISNEIQKVKPWEEYSELAVQGYARQNADWLYGMNFTMYISLLNDNKIFNVGRVMTAIMALISKRNKSIENFVPQPYNMLELTVADATGTEVRANLINPQTRENSFSVNSEYIKNAIEYFKTNKNILIELNSAKKTQKPPKLLSLTELSKVCADKFELSAQNTLSIVQKLYEEYSSQPRRARVTS